MDLTVKNLSKQFVDFKLDNISFELPRGSVMGLIGPNGSGKTTTIKLILNMLKKNQGKIEILGYDNIKEEQIAKENLGIVFDSNYFVDEWNMKMVEKAMSRTIVNFQVICSKGQEKYAWIQTDGGIDLVICIVNTKSQLGNYNTGVKKTIFCN